MNKFKLGQKVMIIKTGKLGRIMQILGEDFDDDGATSLVYSVELNDNNLKKMYTVHDLKGVEDILIAKEKEYLSNIIKPFRDRVENIEKFDCCFDMESVVIYIKDFVPINLPDFKKNTMYQNMELNERYTLEELEL